MKNNLMSRRYMTMFGTKMLKYILLSSTILGIVYVGLTSGMRQFVQRWKEGNRIESFKELPLDNLRRAAKLSRLAYQNGLTTEGIVAFCDGRPLEDAQAYVWDSGDGERWVAFRGTTTGSDLWADLDARAVKMSEASTDVRVHSGFYRQFRSVKESIWDAIGESSQEVIFCGHSMAGALANIAALAWACEHPGRTVKCYTMGAPRTGNHAFAQDVSAYVCECIRVFNENDPVAMVPLSFRFHHVGRGVGVKDGGQVFELREQDDPWWIRPIVSLDDIDFSDLICDHACAVYENRIESMLAGDV